MQLTRINTVPYYLTAEEAKDTTTYLSLGGVSNCYLNMFCKFCGS